MPTTKVLGSVFLGDAKTTVHRHFPGPGSIIVTPPASPSKHEQQLEGIFARMQEGDMLVQQHTNGESDMEGTTMGMTAAAMNVTPAMSLELRLRWLEALLVGVNAKASYSAGMKKGKKMTLFKRAEELQKQMEGIANANEGLKKFMDRCAYGYFLFLPPSFSILTDDTYTPYLTPSFILSGITPQASFLTSSELDALLSEIESDIRSADRDLQEIEELEKRGVMDAEKLGDCERLRGRLEALVNRHEEDLKNAKELEGRIARLLERHATKVGGLLLFPEWGQVWRRWIRSRNCLCHGTMLLLRGKIGLARLRER